MTKAPIVAPAQAKDAEAIIRLFEEMDRFYGSETIGSMDLRMAQVEAALFGPAPVAAALLAWEEDTLAGIASYSRHWPAVGLTQSVYLKELYVADASRGRGVGRALMAALFEVASTQGCSRVEWTTDTGNLAAQRFYEELGAKPRTSKIFYRSEFQ